MSGRRQKRGLISAHSMVAVIGRQTSRGQRVRNRRTRASWKSRVGLTFVDGYVERVILELEFADVHLVPAHLWANDRVLLDHLLDECARVVDVDDVGVALVVPVK